MNNIKYRPKQLTFTAQQPNYLPTHIQFYKWDRENNKFKVLGAMCWDESGEWVPFGERDANYYRMEYLLSQKRSFGDKVYTKTDRDFYKPFYHRPSIGTKVEIGLTPSSKDALIQNQSLPIVNEEVHNNITSLLVDEK